MNDGQPTNSAPYRVDCGGVDDYPHDPGIENKRRYASDRFANNLTVAAHRVDTRHVAHGWDTVAMLAVVLAGTLVMWSCVAMAGPLTETRYCGAPARNADGSIKRSAAVLAAFQRIHPCPSTGKMVGACPGWARNHNLPLACGGCDSVANLSWLPNDIKSCAGAHCVDRFERKINALTPPIPDTGACKNEVVP